MRRFALQYFVCMVIKRRPTYGKLLMKALPALVLCTFFLSGCGGGSSSSGGGSSSFPIDGAQDPRFAEKVEMAFYSLPAGWQSLVQKYSSGVRKSTTNAAGWDRWILMDISQLSFQTPSWIGGILCHEAAHHKQMEQKRIDGLTDLEREKEARSWQLGCLKEMGAPQHEIDLVKRFGVSHFERGRGSLDD